MICDITYTTPKHQMQTIANAKNEDEKEISSVRSTSTTISTKKKEK